MNDYFIDRLNFNRNIISQNINDLTEDIFQISIDQKHNSICYILGHLAMSRHYLSNMISDSKTELLYPELFGYKQSFDKSKTYPQKEILVDYFITCSNQLNINVALVTDFFVEMDTKIPAYSNRLDHVISFLIDHEMYHIGQISIIRKLMNFKSVPFK